jgi:hypothetical protein
MQISGTMKPRRRWLGTIVVGIVVIAVLAGAAFMWGSVLKADTTNSTAQSAPAAPASAYNGSMGLAAIRSADMSLAQARNTALLGVAAVRAIDSAK